MNRYEEKVLPLLTLKEGARIAITGATSGIGKSIAAFFSSLPVTLILVGRNENKLHLLEKELPGSKAELILFPLNLTDRKAVRTSIPRLKKLNIDYFYNNAGVYHQPIDTKDNGLDSSFLVDYLVPAYFMKELSKGRSITFINTASISYHYHKFETEIQGLDIKSKIKRYGFLKRILIMETIYLRRQGIDCYLAHPGISYTGLFSKGNGAYPPFILSLIKWPMKAIFMSPDKACLSLVECASLRPEDETYYLGPRGLFHGWGYPSFQKLSSSIFCEEDMKHLDKETDRYLKEYLSE